MKKLQKYFESNYIQYEILKKKYQLEFKSKNELLQNLTKKKQSDQQIQIIMQEYFEVNVNDTDIFIPANKWIKENGLQLYIKKNKDKLREEIYNQISLNKKKLILNLKRIWLLIPRLQSND